MKTQDPNSRITLKGAYDAAVNRLELNSIEDAKTDAWLLMEKATGYSRNEYFMHRDDVITKTQAKLYDEMVSKRAERIPLQHITGEAYFYGRRFCVNENVLIPRADTEIIVEEAIKHIHPGMDVLDLCTGSGCIAITLALETKAKLTASDLSKTALDVARKNADTLGADVGFIKSDMFKSITERYDVIVSNPPYIRSSDIDSLQDEVRLHDPREALDGGADGLEFYRIIASEARNYLKPDGRLLLEIGYDQAQDVSTLLWQAGFADVEVRKDLGGLDRVVSCKNTDV